MVTDTSGRFIGNAIKTALHWSKTEIHGSKRLLIFYDTATATSVS